MTRIKFSNGLLFILSASLLLSLLFVPYYNLLCCDKEVYRCVGRVILRGGVPYRDIFDHKPPLIFFLNYIALLLGGDWAQWVIDTVLVGLATGLFFQLGKKYRLPFPWILPLLFNLMLRDWQMSLGMGMTREYTTVLQLIFFCVLLGKYRYRYFLMGLLSALIFFMQQDQVLALVPFFIYAFLPREDTLPVFTRILWTATGFLTVTIPVVGYFVIHGSLVYFWQDAFLFNMGWYTNTLKESFREHLRKLRVTLDKGNYEVPFMVAITLGVCSLFFRTKRKGLIFACGVAVVFSVIPEFLGGRDRIPIIDGMGFTHYFLPLSASLCCLLFLVFAFTEEPSLQGRKAHAIFGILLCTSLLYSAVQHGTHLVPTKEDDAVTNPEMDYLRQHRPGAYQLFVFGNTNATYAYNEFNIPAPSKWIYQHFYALYDNWDQDHSILFSIEQDLLRHGTIYILDYAADHFFRDPSIAILWRSFLEKHYQRIDIPGRPLLQLWKWKDTQE